MRLKNSKLTSPRFPHRKLKPAFALPSVPRDTTPSTQKQAVERALRSPSEVTCHRLHERATPWQPAARERSAGQTSFRRSRPATRHGGLGQHRWPLDLHPRPHPAPPSGTRLLRIIPPLRCQVPGPGRLPSLRRHLIPRPRPQPARTPQG